MSLKKACNELKYGDLIEVKGEYIIPSEARNYKGFNYRDYLKTKKIYGTIKSTSNNINVLKENDINIIFILLNNIRNYIVKITNKLLPQKTANLLIGILIGDKSGIEETIIQNFKTSNLSHMLAVSGAHTSYIILGITYILSKSKISKRWIYIIVIIMLFIFMFITNFTSSVTRACIMAILVLGANLLYRKQDFWTSISISILITLIINPFAINEIGLQLSYLGTIGIILFNKNIEDILNKVKISSKISKVLSVTISAQIAIMPIMIYSFNSLSLTFFISNVLASPFLGINIVLGFITIIISLVSFKLAYFISFFLNLSLEILIFISEFIAKLPMSSILVKTPQIITLFLIYVFSLGLNYIYSIYNSHTNLRLFQKKLLKKITKKNIKKFVSITIILVFLFNVFSLLIPRNLKIHFIDVGQGDSCLIVTPKNKKILIDGGEKTDVILPYLLDRRTKTLDYIIISHFDSDHSEGIVKSLEKLKVKNIIIGKQFETCENYKEFVELVKEKNIKVNVVEAGKRINIEKDLYFDILWPDSNNVIHDNSINNNSLVCKLVYKDFSILFTGDIEEKAEKAILQKYKNNLSLLNTTILKTAHHGSKTSSTKEFLDAVRPKLALIGVGENNTFGHPSNITLENLQNMGCKIYRTDENGEISIKVNRKGKIWIDKMLN